MSVIIRIIIGLGIIAGIIWMRGDEAGLLEALKAAGWQSVVMVSVYHTFVPVALCGVAWRILVVDAPRGAAGTFLLARWVRDAVNQLLPLLPLGGEVVGARMVMQGGVAVSTAAAATVVDVTAEVLSQALYSMIGVAMWIIGHPGAEMLGWAGVGVALMLPMLGGLVAAQRFGMIRLLEKLADKVMPDTWKLPENSGSIHDCIVAIYSERRRFTLAVCVHLASWLLASLESWLVLRMMGVPFTIGDAIALESVIYAVRASAFLVPGALGIQEGAYLLVGAALGLPSEAALAVSLVKRGRELTVGIPSLLIWQWLSHSRNRVRSSS